MRPTPEQRESVEAAYREASEAFVNGAVGKASRATLEKWLLAMCSMIKEDPKAMDMNRMRADALQHLLAAKVSDETSRRAFWVSIVAIVVSVVSLAWTLAVSVLEFE